MTRRPARLLLACLAVLAVAVPPPVAPVRVPATAPAVTLRHREPPEPRLRTVRASRARPAPAVATRRRDTSVDRKTLTIRFRGPALLRRIGGCESSGRPDGPLLWTVLNRQGSSASGAYQVLDRTWRGWLAKYTPEWVGRWRRAYLAPPHAQHRVVSLAFARQGTGPWLASRHCWR